MVDIGVILKTESLAKTIAGYLGLIENIGLKVDKLSRSELGAALSALEQGANSRTEQISLLREARGHFNKALHIETGERLALSYFGLALCHHRLDDFDNAKSAMNSVLDINNYIEKPSKISIIFSEYVLFKAIKNINILLKIQPIMRQAKLYLDNGITP